MGSSRRDRSWMQCDEFRCEARLKLQRAAVGASTGRSTSTQSNGITNRIALGITELPKRGADRHAVERPDRVTNAITEREPVHLAVAIAERQPIYEPERVAQHVASKRPDGLAERKSIG